MLQLSAAATRQVIMGYKCVHEGCQRSFESRKGYRKIAALQAVLRHPVWAPSHFARRCRCWTPKASSPAHCRRSTSSLIKVHIARICENRNCELLWMLRKSANYIWKISCISQQNLLAKVRQNASHFADFAKYYKIFAKYYRILPNIQDFLKDIF